MNSSIRFGLNGRPVSIETHDSRILLSVLRSDLGLTGTKYGCGEGYCGACTVLVNQQPTRSCLLRLRDVAGTEVVTIEGASAKGILNAVQQAFVDHDALQCGFCTPGQLCSIVGMLAEFGKGAPSAVTKDGAATGELTEAEVRERMSGNLCRCGAYVGIRDAIKQVYGRAKQ